MSQAMAVTTGIIQYIIVVEFTGALGLLRQLITNYHRAMVAKQ